MWIREPIANELIVISGQHSQTSYNACIGGIGLNWLISRISICPGLVVGERGVQSRGADLNVTSHLLAVPGW